jgi:hypothetical protein
MVFGGNNTNIKYKILNTKDNIHLTSLESLQQLKNKDEIEELNITNCNDNDFNIEFSDFINLKTLDLYNNINLIRISSLDKCKKLILLNIYGCDSLLNLPNLDFLVNLEMLYLNKNLLLTEYPRFEKLTKLKFLRISIENNMTQNPYINCLKNLEILEIIGNMGNMGNVFSPNNNINKIETDLPCIDSLINLKKFTCFNFKLKKLPNLDNCIKLNKLHCIGCHLKTIPNLKNCINLEELLLNNNELTEFPSINCKNTLWKLQIFNNNITSLPRDIIYYTKIKLYDCIECKEFYIHKPFKDYKELYNNNFPQLINRLIEKVYYIPIIKYYYNMLLMRNYDTNRYM